MTSLRTIRLGVTDLSFHHATAAVVTQVLQQLGFTVERSFNVHEANFERLRTGAIDLLASAWLPHSHGVYKAQVEDVVATRELGLHYAPYALWGVPDYVPQADVDTIEDLLKPDVVARINPSIQGIGPGAGITRFSLRVMEDYGLNAAGYHFHTGTQNDCIAAFEQLVATQKWGIVPLWHPQFLHARHAIRELKDPKGLLGGTDRAVLLAREDRLTLFTANELQVLDNIRLSNAIVSELDYAINREQHTPDEAAQDWLARHPDILAAWLTPVSTPEQRLRNAGLCLPAPPPALGNYVPWSIVGNTLMTSGQFPWIDGELQYRGRLGRDLTIEQGYAACRLAALNAIGQLKSALGDLSRVKQIYRLEGVLNVAEDFYTHPKALDGASDLMVEVFGERGKHSRMIWTNPVMPMDGFCLVYLFAEIEPNRAPSMSLNG